MGRSAAARALSAPYAVGFAEAVDDVEIRQLLRETEFAGDVRLSLERESDSSVSSAIEGDVHGTIVARDSATGALAGIASRSIRDVFINGRPARVGYLGQLRIAPAYRSRRELLEAGFDFCRMLHDRQRDCSLYLASVVTDNEQARRLLSRRAKGWPRFEPIDSLTSLAIPVGHVRLQPSRVMVQPGTPASIDDIIECLSRNGAAWQFYPRWRAADFGCSRLIGLDPSDFMMATRDGRTVGCVACWDQRAFKQVIVKGYSPRLARSRRFVNLLAPFTGTPRLPREGSQLQFAYLSHLAVERNDDEEVLTALVEGARRRAMEKGLDYVVLGLSSRSTAFQAIARAFRHRAYESVLYVAFWPDGEVAAQSLDGRPSHPELAIL